MPDPCDFLAPDPTSPDTLAQERILGRTLKLLRRRRWLRRAAWVASLAACFAGGVLTTLALRPASTTIVVQQVLVNPPAPAPEPELKVLPPETERPKLLRQVADRMLAEDDPLTALHCYSRSLDEGDRSDLVASTEDSWLLLAIKDARLKEKRDAKRAE